MNGTVAEFVLVGGLGFIGGAFVVALYFAIASWRGGE